MADRRHSSVVNISGLKMGGDNPVRIQSMTTTNTLDTEKTVEQAIKIIDAGGELVRVTAQGIKEAENLKNIKESLLSKGYMQPLVADIHFNPKAAAIAALYVDKVRINPGNFIDKRAVFEKLDYTDLEYAAELEDLYARFSSFLKICKENNTAVRIGTNQGSLSDRIMSRYGDTPEGMVEATMEFLRVCKQESFDDVVISLKSSNTVVMVNAVRLLVEAMNQEDMCYPLHLGVTEAGEGEDGRIKSAIGTGALLADGIGDTIRVSLTEEPENEIPVARKLVDYSMAKSEYIEKFDYLDKRASFLSGYKYPVVVVDFSHDDIPGFDIPELSGYKKIGEEEWEEKEQPSEFIYVDALGPGLSALPKQLNVIVPGVMWDVAHVYNRNACPLFTIDEYAEFRIEKSDARFHFIEVESEQEINIIKNDEKAVAIIYVNRDSLSNARNIAVSCAEFNIPVIAKSEYRESNYEDISIKSSVDMGALCLDKLCSGIWVDSNGLIKEEEVKKLSYSILQAAHFRITKTEFISCPGCGRTLFNLQKTVARVKNELAHLKCLKIGIMGCIVNGPGEMGDVDYGYVGAAKGKVTLYKGRQVVKKNIPEENALDELIALIKLNGDWIDK